MRMLVRGSSHITFSHVLSIPCRWHCRCQAEMYLFYCSWAAAIPMLVCQSRSEIKVPGSSFGLRRVWRKISSHALPRIREISSHGSAYPFCRLARSLLSSADYGGHLVRWLTHLQTFGYRTLALKKSGVRWERDLRPCLAAPRVVEGLRHPSVPCKTSKII